MSDRTNHSGTGKKGTGTLRTLTIVASGKSAYSIVRTSDRREQHLDTVLCERIRDTITSLTGVTLPIVDSETPDPENCHIIVGPTDRPVDPTLMRGVLPGGYTVKTCKNSIVLGAWADLQYQSAAERLIELFRTYADGGDLALPAPDETHYLPCRPSASPAEKRNAYRKFVFTYYFGPRADECTEETVRLIRDCGMTRMQIPDELIADSGDEKAKVAAVRKAIETCGRAGMDAALFIEHSLGRINYPPRSLEDIPQEEVDRLVKKVVDDYGDLKDLAEWYIRDEPHAEEIPIFEKIVDAFHRFDPDRPVMINFLPGFGIPYNEYIEGFAKAMPLDALSFDRYRFFGDPPELGSRTYFDSMFTFREIAHRYGLPATMIVLLSAHYTLSDLAEEQLRWEVNTCLAYGYKCVSFFTMRNLGNCGGDLGTRGGGMLDMDNKPLGQYEYVKNISKDVVPVGNQLARQEFQTVWHIDTPEYLGAPAYIPFGPLGRIGGKNGIIGFFDDGSFYLVNYIYDTGAPENVFTLSEYDGDTLEFFDPAEERWRDAESSAKITRSGRCYTVSLPSGDGVLLRTVRR